MSVRELGANDLLARNHKKSEVPLEDAAENAAGNATENPR